LDELIRLIENRRFPFFFNSSPSTVIDYQV
jgi:hypothetical protein